MKENKIKKEVKKVWFKTFGRIRGNKIKNKKFTIISNNCFGGVIYRNFHIPYQSPTCGLFFVAPEYIKFINDIKKYTNTSNYIEFKQINIKESKYSEFLEKNDYKGIIGKYKDLEICFLHYSSIEEINDKWNKRSKRINWDRIIYKFNDQNLCDIKCLKAFEKFDCKNKICFTSKKYDSINSIVLKKYKDCDYVLSDTKEKDYNDCLNIIDYINNV